MSFRIGFGYDVHRLEEGLPFWIGGIRIPHDRGAVGHSDADVLLHAICDALLGAAALGDIGTHFPDSDPAYRRIASTILLQRTTEMVRQKGYDIQNVDSTVCLQAPKIKSLVPEMRRHIASALGVETGLVSVKATTEEKMGVTGKGAGVAAYAVVMLRENP